MTGTLSFIAGERQSAVSADMRRYYGVSLNDALNTWTGKDLSSAVRNLPPDSATVRAELGDLWDWNHLAANMAELVDLMHFWLNSEYNRWIYDPDDPENKRREKSKRKPPPQPLIPPIAYRPPSVALTRLEAYAEQVAQFSGDPSSSEKWVTSDEFDSYLDEL